MGSVTQHQQLQQHVQVSRKRSSEQRDNECSEKSKKPNEETETTKGDLEDGANLSVQVEQVKLLSQQYISSGTQEDLPCCIQSLLRRDRQVRPGETDGNLLKAGSDRSPETINVEFTGTSTEDPATAFHKELCNHGKEVYVLRHREVDGDYYLKVKKSGGVNLRKLVNFPTDDKYFFRIERINNDDGGIAFAIQSLKYKGWYLHTSDLGKVSMTEVTTGPPDDLHTWFTFLWKEHVVQYQQMSMVYSRNDSGIECDLSEETILDVKDSGKDVDPGNAVEENLEEAQKENAENPEVGNSEALGEDNFNSTGSGKSQGEAEATPEDQKEEHSGEL